MRHLLSGALDRYFAPAPPQRLAALRVLVGGFAVVWLVVRSPEMWRVAGLDPARFDPVGPWWFLTDPLPAGLVRAALAGTVVAGLAFVVGARFALSGPVFAVGLLALAAYRSSWGLVFHTENLLVLHVLILAFAPAAAVWSCDRTRHHGAEPAPASRFGWPVRLMMVVVVLTYAIAGWAKLRNGGWDWVAGDVLHHQVAFDNLRKVVVGDVSAPLGRVAVGHGWLFPPMAWFTVVVEIGAPLALLGGTVRRARVAAVWLLHVGIVVLMAIVFAYPLSGIAFAPFFAIERLPERCARPIRAWRAQAGAPAQVAGDARAARFAPH